MFFNTGTYAFIMDHFDKGNKKYLKTSLFCPEAEVQIFSVPKIIFIQPIEPIPD